MIVAIPSKPRGPKRQRFLIGFLSVVLTVLLLWLLGFLVNDIGRTPGPDFDVIVDQHISPDLQERERQLAEDRKAIERQIENQKEIQSILETSTRNSQQTMNQLLEMHRHNLEREITPSEAEQSALAQSESLFLENQRKFQEANEAITLLSEKKRLLDSQSQDLVKELEPLREEARTEFNQAYSRHQIKVATMKLVVLLPVLFLATWWLRIKRNTSYSPFFVSFFVASFIQVSLVIHEYFPSRYFKYVAVVAAIAVVVGIMRFLILRLAKPEKEYLLQQYREAYQRHRCPICTYPIERGIFRQALWTSKGPKLVSGYQSENVSSKETPYTCPSCGSVLFEECAECGEVRHAFLPHCERCGVEKVNLE